VKLIGLHPDADVELNEAARYYESRKAGLGLDLLGEVERAFDQILKNPEASRRIGRRVRRKPLWRFPYNLIYAVYPERIRIVAFAHQKRRPFYWRKRLKNTAELEGPTMPIGL
jgi:plasmid stabilization system protein ParE